MCCISKVVLYCCAKLQESALKVIVVFFLFVFFVLFYTENDQVYDSILYIYCLIKNRFMKESCYSLKKKLIEKLPTTASCPVSSVGRASDF